MLTFSSMKAWCFFCVVVLLAHSSVAYAVTGDSLTHQAKAASCCALDSSREFSILYQNDLFAGADRYYTQGVFVSLRHPALRCLDVGGLLTPRRGNNRQYVVTAILQAYTPSSIRSDSILRGDRPYAGLFYLTASGGSSPLNSVWSMSGALSLGIIGPAAQGKEIQVSIHRATDNFIPLGWQHQIKNDVVLNYSLRVHYTRFRRANFSLKPFSEVKVGTLEDRFVAGIDASIASGSGADPKRSRVTLAAYFAGEAVGYDARLQGGFFNRRSPYILSATEISRFVARGVLTLHFSTRGAFAGINYTALTREFRTGTPHAWGGLYAGFKF